ncbi:Synerg-CTERM sorting domain-containing protein [Cloacibacillus evryensis]|uniref:Synerg-CTERM sorting domain-containing protein n=1 Tax=Cloacibacillus evryensis TaxID=508460 RepID=UPI0004490EFC|nr:Synerg-CTERM sorting domain-containing protein [Cloacibacillus evryensis]EXG78277.1 hypothetical protein Cloev_0389 [Cloacibacillus evryensis DSM 19522]MEA5035427.1 Synerg-CTERM sorting domain-containing protein [Cloacibacillus evryensis]
MNKSFKKLGRNLALAAAAIFVVILFAGSMIGASDSWTPDTSWYDNYKNERGSAENPFLISSPEELAGLAKITNVAFGQWGVTKVSLKDKHILLTRDINLEDKEWAPIGWYLSYTEKSSWGSVTKEYAGFDGNFNGGGHTISGLKIETCENVPLYSSKQTEAAGLFGYISIDGKVRNLVVKGKVNASECEGVGGIAGWADGLIENCVTDVEVRATSSKRGYAGGIAGLNGGPQGDDMTSGNPYAIIRNNVVLGSVFSTPASFAYAGGIVGFSHWYKGEVLNNVALSPSIVSGMDAGGIFGGFNSFVTADNVSAAQKLAGAPGYVGGVVGAFGWGYQNCYWLSVNRDQPVGGITDPAKLPVTAVAMDTDNLKTIKSGETRDIHITAYPLTADASSLKYTWSVDKSKLEVIKGAGTPTLTVKAKDGAGTEDLFAVISADVYGLLGHTESQSGGSVVYISNFETTASVQGVLKITQGAIPVEGITAYGSNTAWKEGETRVLGASVRPSDADARDVVWTLSAVSGAASSEDVIMEDAGNGNLSILLRSGHEKDYAYTFTAATADGKFSDSITVVGDPVTDVEISGFIPTGDAVPNYIDAVKPVGATSAVIEDIAAAVGVDVSVFRVGLNGVLYLNSETVNAAVKDAEDRDNLKVTAIIPLPLFSVKVSAAGKIAAAGMIISGDRLMAETPQKVALVKTRPDGTGEFFTYAEDQDAIGNKRFTLQTMDDKTMAPTDKIDPAQTYKLVLYIQDNGGFDIDPADCSIIDPVAIVKLAEETPAPSGSSSGGCNAGVAGIMLLAVIPLLTRAAKKKS